MAETPRTRADHLAWAKARALAYCDQNEPGNAFASLASDLKEHPETASHFGLKLGMMQVMAGFLRDADAMRQFINGFN